MELHRHEGSAYPFCRSISYAMGSINMTGSNTPSELNTDVGLFRGTFTMLKTVEARSGEISMP